MESLKVNTCVMLNDIIYRINRIENTDEMRLSVLRQLKMFIGFDYATFYLSDLEGLCLLQRPVCLGMEQKYVDLFLQRNDELDYAKGFKISSKCMVYKETDVISREKWEQTEYYRVICIPNNINNIIRVILAYKDEFLGVVSLFRTKERGDFNDEEFFILNTLKDHLALRLNKEKEATKKVAEKLSVLETSLKYRLTAREEYILGLLVKGVNNDEICLHLFITQSTLKKHILNIYRKLNINNRVQLLMMVG